MSNNSNAIISKPKATPRKPKATPRKPKATPRKPKATPRKPKAAPRKPKVSPRKPKVSPRKPKATTIVQSDSPQIENQNENLNENESQNLTIDEQSNLSKQRTHKPLVKSKKKSQGYKVTPKTKISTKMRLRNLRKKQENRRRRLATKDFRMPNNSNITPSEFTNSNKNEKQMPTYARNLVQPFKASKKLNNNITTSILKQRQTNITNNNVNTNNSFLSAKSPAPISTKINNSFLTANNTPSNRNTNKSQASLLKSLEPLKTQRGKKVSKRKPKTKAKNPNHKQEVLQIRKQRDKKRTQKRKSNRNKKYKVNFGSN